MARLLVALCRGNAVGFVRAWLFCEMSKHIVPLATVSGLSDAQQADSTGSGGAGSREGQAGAGGGGRSCVGSVNGVQLSGLCFQPSPKLDTVGPRLEIDRHVPFRESTATINHRKARIG